MVKAIKENKDIDPNLNFFPRKIKKQNKMGTKYDKETLLKNLNIDNMSSEEYLPSPIDCSDYVEVKPVNLLKAFNGRGLFAKKDIPAKTCIGAYTGQEYSFKRFSTFLEKTPGMNGDYALTCGKDKIIDAQIKGNFTRYANYSTSQAQLMFVGGSFKRKNIAKVITTKNIKQGEQLLIDYNVYDPNVTLNYCFLNPQDGWLSTKETYEKNKNNYFPIELDKQLDALGLKLNEKLFATKVMIVILAGKNLPAYLKSIESEDINLPCLRVNNEFSFTNFDEADTCTSMMLASYLGQFENTEYLIQRNANVDQQQNKSGMCPLFLALEGYRQHNGDRTNYVKIMVSLINHGANIFTADRCDKTFLHKAISVLSDNDFEFVLSTIKLLYKNNFFKLFDYVDNQDLDLVQTCLKLKSFNKFKQLVQLNPNYFQENYKRTKKKQDTEVLKEIFKGYEEQDVNKLYQFIKDHKIKINNTLMKELNIYRKPENENVYRSVGL